MLLLRLERMTWLVNDLFLKMEGTRSLETLTVESIAHENFVSSSSSLISDGLATSKARLCTVQERVDELRNLTDDISTKGTERDLAETIMPGSQTMQSIVITNILSSNLPKFFLPRLPVCFNVSERLKSEQMAVISGPGGYGKSLNPFSPT